MCIYMYIYMRRKWQPIPVSLPGEFHEQRSLVGYIVHEIAKSRTQLNNYHSIYFICFLAVLGLSCCAGFL